MHEKYFTAAATVSYPHDVALRDCVSLVGPVEDSVISPLFIARNEKPTRCWTFLGVY